MFEKIVLVTRRTRLEDLVLRFGSERQARFYIESSGGDFGDYADEHSRYVASLEAVRPVLASFDDLRLQPLDRALVKTYLFTEKDLIVTLGQDGLVANTAKYVGDQPIVAINPDPERYDGILLPFRPSDAGQVVRAVIAGKLEAKRVTLGEARFSDGQSLLAFNDFFIGAKSHVSARYRIGVNAPTESQSSSGVIVSTGAGSTGWLSSVFNMVGGIAAATGGAGGTRLQLSRDEKKLVFVVREPFASRHSSAKTVLGFIDEQSPLVLQSMMPSGGVLFSDGVEEDFISFNSGATVTILPAARQSRLVAPI